MFTKLFIFIINIYQKVFSLETGALARSGFFQKRLVCAFYPSCSEYSKISIKKYGIARGLKKTCLRLLRCHPWQKGGLDLP